MRKSNGFTLIELLAVIVILAIIAVIATPLTINVINDSRERSFINSVYGLIDGARLLSAEQLFDDGSNEVVVEFQDGTTDNENFKISGDMPNSGTIHLNSEGKVELKIWSEELGKCAEKSATEAEVKLTETTKEDCKIEVETEIKQCSTVVLGKDITIGEVVCEDPDLNARYVGADPNNYVTFNGERWRIIGVFNGQTKIIRSKSYDWESSWDTDGLNNWATASLKKSLNDGDYSFLNSIKTDDLNSYNYIDLNHKWNIGAVENYSTRSSFYNGERSKTKTPAMTDHLWNGAIGLIYPSDYLYATSSGGNECENGADESYQNCSYDNWIYNMLYIHSWTISAVAGNDKSVYYLADANRIYTDLTASYYCGGMDCAYYYAYPTLYLKKEVKIIGGLGTYDEPYTLGM